MPLEALAGRLKALRETKGLTKYRLAKVSGVSETYIYRIERGLIRNPRRDTLEKLAQGLGIPLTQLIGEITPVATWQLVEQSLKAYVPVYDEIPVREGKEPIDYMAVSRVGTPPPTLRGFRVASLFLEPEIRPGDTVFVDTVGVPLNGDLVVALKDDLAFLARYNLDGGKAGLITGASRFALEDVTIYGVVTGYGHVFRRT